MKPILSLRIGDEDVHPDQIVSFGPDYIRLNSPSQPIMFVTAGERKTLYNQWLAYRQQFMAMLTATTTPAAVPPARKITRATKTAQTSGATGGN